MTAVPVSLIVVSADTQGGMWGKDIKSVEEK